MFITGNYFKGLCRVTVGKYLDARNAVFCVEEHNHVDNFMVFCKTEFLEQLVASVEFPKNSILITHNSDINIEDNHRRIFDFCPNIDMWYAQNLLTEHKRIKPIPIGIANPKWSHGNQYRFREVQQEKIHKNNLLYVNFNVATNQRERLFCLENIGKKIETAYPSASIKEHDNFVEKTHKKYLRDIKASFFVASPDGNGVDCHKTWESIYMGSIPIVTDSVLAREFKKLGIPLLILDSWKDYKESLLSEQLYYDTWKDFDAAKLDWNFFK